jgi:hypothetical protein
VRPGSAFHRDLFCRTFIETHVPYEPERLPWPALDGVHLERLRAIPFWGHARAIEHHAGEMVSDFAATLADAQIREAVALQGYEERRHGLLMAHVIERYGIDVPAAAPEGSSDGANADDFLVFGFSECADSFAGFGAFAIARAMRLFPESLLGIFEQVLFEEARHITFFINWWRYELARDGDPNALQRTLRAVGYHIRAVRQVAHTVGDGPPISLSDARAVFPGVTPAEFLAAGLAENRRVLARLDRRLIKPRLVPRIATALLLAIRMLPPRPAAAPETALANA